MNLFFLLSELFFSFIYRQAGAQAYSEAVERAQEASPTAMARSRRCGPRRRLGATGLFLFHFQFLNSRVRVVLTCRGCGPPGGGEVGVGP
jgi:hypothetical protein